MSAAAAAAAAAAADADADAEATVVPGLRLARRHAAALACSALALLAPPVPATGPAANVRIENYAYVPAEVTVRAGGVVRWENGEKRVSHSVLFTGPGGFESERFFPGERYERRFDIPGRYAYTCGPHPEMKGVVVVVP